MDYWFLDNLENLVPFVIALLYFLGTSRAKKAQKKAEKADPQAEERARQVQEEIRRKILERQQRGNAPPQQPERPSPFETREEEEASYFPDLERTFREFVEPAAPEPKPVYEAPKAPPVDPFEEQRKQIEEQLRKAEAIAAMRPADTNSAYRRPVSSRRQAELEHAQRDHLLRGLTNKAELRRAIVLKEILDTPLALR